MKDPKKIYEANINSLKIQETELKKKRSLMAWGRFLIIVLIVWWFYTQWHNGWQLTIVGFVVGIALFLFFVAKDVNLKNNRLYTQQLLRINSKEIEGLHLQYTDWETGAEYSNATHPYIGDLDIFGKHSLFQYVNRAESEGGRALLANYLSSVETKESIVARQDAVKVLTAQTEWRQKLQAYGNLASVDSSIEKDIALWLGQPIPSKSNFWKMLIWVYPVITLSSAYLYLNDTIPSGIFGLLLIVFIVFSFAQSKKNNDTFLLLSKFYPKISVIKNFIATIEEMETSDSQELIKLKETIVTNSHQKASDSLEKLGKQLGLFEARLNVFLYFFLNTFLLWDVRVAIGLQDWKRLYGNNMIDWLKTIYQAEVYNSFATLSFNNPEWIFPEIASEYYHFEGINVGHPLISKEKRVDNSFSIEGKGKIALITGSNMGGKSTFLRSLGVNMVLAYAGAPVCAEKFNVSVAKLMSSMRIADNLAENTSTFYAELKKIRAIIDAVKAGEEVFVLLDEILRGTNSLDRHSGSKALMMQLIRDKVVAVIATHDVELATLLTAEPGAITNYHFDVQVDSNDALYFDYKLKNGVCQRMNAAILMKQIGIEL